MHLKLVFIVLLAAASSHAQSVVDGVYTTAQAARGQSLYNTNCAACHGDQLTGGETAPPLTGGDFLSNWNGLTVGDLLERIRTSMPLGAPGKLSREVNADITAYILKTNNYPAGDTELDKRTEFLKQIKIEPAKPASAASTPRVQPNSPPNPYRTVENFFQMPEGRRWGSTSAITLDRAGNFWIAERCGANTCAGSPLDPVLQFDPSGKLLKSFGAGKFVFPHGILVSSDGSIWVVDGQGRNGIGHQVIRFTPDGKEIMRFGKAGIPGDTPETLNQPNCVIEAPDGDIFIADGHSVGTGNARVLKFAKDGRFIKSWGSHGSGPGQFEMPHALAFDSQGRLFVADRGNNRIQIFDQDGRYLDQLTRFGRPSGIFIDKNDVLYVADSESRDKEGYGHNPGWKRGIRVGSLKDGLVTAFIPDPEPNQENLATSAAEGVAADSAGNVYGAEVGPKGIRKYVRK
jgi:mono/diheme cytochrome c family protein/sugar lactone lactonase YvrE